MKKLTSKDEMFKKIKKFYKEDTDEIEVEVISNVFNGPTQDKWIKNLDPKWNKFLNFFINDRVASSLIMWRLYEMLSAQYGKCDFKFEGNREYKNWLVENEGIYFILSTKSEFVLPTSKEQSKNLGNALVSLHYELFNKTLSFIQNNPDVYGDGFEEIQKHISKLEKKKIIVDNCFKL